MRVLIINHFPLTGSGSGTYTRNIAAHLIKKGHEVCVVMPENTVSYNIPDGVRVEAVFFTDAERIDNALPFNFPCFTTHPRSLETFFDLTDGQIDTYMSAFKERLSRVIDEFKPDLIHAQHVWLLSYVASETGIPYVVTAHGTDLMGYQKTSRFRRYADLAAERAKSIITISKDNDELVREIFPSCADKVVFLKNGYDPERFYPESVSKDEVLAEYDIPPMPHIVLFSGKLTHFKGVDILLEAARLYEGEHRGKIATVIAGDGELSRRLKKQAEDFGLRSVHFIGFASVNKLRRLYSAADVTVVPSRREPFGLVAVEALACGSPVVATNQGGLPDIINDQVGALVDVDDPFGLFTAICSEIFRPDRAERGRRASEYALSVYAQDKLIDSMIEIYSQ